MAYMPSFSPIQIDLFRSLLATRDDVFARYWVDMMNNKTGFAPVYHLNQKSYALTDDVICDHLLGNQTIGVYPLFPDNTTAFLVIDFDGKDWHGLSCSVIDQVKADMCGYFLINALLHTKHDNWESCSCPKLE
jgi:hypothetical protein